MVDAPVVEVTVLTSCKGTEVALMEIVAPGMVVLMGMAVRTGKVVLMGMVVLSSMAVAFLMLEVPSKIVGTRMEIGLVDSEALTYRVLEPAFWELVSYTATVAVLVVACKVAASSSLAVTSRKGIVVS